MKIHSLMLCMILTLLWTTIIEAQEQERRGRVGLVRAYNIGDIVIVASDAAVQQELGLSPEAVAKVKAAQDAFVATVREKLQRSLRYRLGVSDGGSTRNVQGPTGDSREAFKAAVNLYLSDLKDAFTADQHTRLQQINWQVMGTTAFSEVEVINALMITKEQQERISSIQDEYSIKRQKLFDSFREGGQRPRRLRRDAESQEKLAALNQEEDLKINEALTPDQLARFAILKGNEFAVADLREHGGLGETSLLRPNRGGGFDKALLLMQNRRPTIFDIIESEALHTELAISSGDVAKLKKLASEFRVAAREMTGDLPLFEGKPTAETVQAIQKMANANMAAAEKLLPKLKGTLTADQFSRLQQIYWQVLRAAALSEPDVITALPLTKAQQDQIAAICAEYEQKQLGLVTDNENERALDLRPKLRELNKERDAKLEELLTKDQLDRFAALKGAEFEISRIRISGRGGRIATGADPDFDTSIAQPAYTDRHPAVLFDEAHRNFHTSTRNYNAFADLMTNDGYQVSPGTEKFTTDQLSRYQVLVIVNAPASIESTKSAFSDEECDAVQNWVKAGGALLLITDHEPFASGSRELAQRFGVNMSTRVTRDPTNETANGLPFSREKNQIGDHPIMRGRSDAETVNRVLTFTGQSLEGPPGSVALLKFSETAFENTKESDEDQDEAGNKISAAGRAQGVALKYERGRVVIMGEARQLSAQLSGVPPRPTGMNVPGCDNRKMAINLIHWLSGLID